MNVLRLRKTEESKIDAVVLAGVSSAVAQVVAASLNSQSGQSGYVYKVKEDEKQK